MGKYLRLFETHTEYEEARKNLILPNVSYCEDDNEVHYNPIPDYSNEYLTFVAKGSGIFTFTPQNSNVISYSTDNGTTWTEGNSVSVNNGDKVMWKGTLTSVEKKGIGKFSATGNFDVQGNIMSLLFGDDFKGQTSLNGKNYAFYGLFYDNEYITSAENLSLLATTLASDCYNSMFYNCSSLTTAPELPATTLASDCYNSMFFGCTSLRTAPELPATMLAQSCYYNMFTNCSSLTTAPELPATTLANSCYSYMFNGCSSLTTAPELPATTLAERCYSNMFAGCTSLTTAPSVLPATTLTNWCYSSMFASCTSLTTAPELPATTLAKGCYNYMFNGCTSLNSIKCIATDISASNCTFNWVDGVAASGTFTKAASMSSWTTGANGIPSGWTVVNA